MTKDSIIAIMRSRLASPNWTDERILETTRNESGISTEQAREYLTEAKAAPTELTQEQQAEITTLQDRMRDWIFDAQRTQRSSRAEGIVPKVIAVKREVIETAIESGMSIEVAEPLFDAVALQITNEAGQAAEGDDPDRDLWADLPEPNETNDWEQRKRAFATALESGNSDRWEIAEQFNLSPTDAARLENQLLAEHIAETAGLPVSQVHVPSRHYKTARHYAKPPVRPSVIQV